MTVEQVKSLMESSQTEEEWNANCDRVKGAHDGYPSFWFSEIIQSGLASRVFSRFGQNDQIKIQTITLK